MRFIKLMTAVLVAVIFASTTVNAQFDIFGAVNGRIETSTGRGVGRSAVTITNLDTLESQTRLTNDFGYFRFEGLPILGFYLVSVRSKRHTFLSSSQVFQFTGTEHYALFVARNGLTPVEP